MRSVVVNSVDELADHRDRWEALRRDCRGTIYASFNVTRTWFECFREQASPRVILLEDGGELVGIAPLSFHRYSSKGMAIKVLALAGEVPLRLWLPTTSIMLRPGREDLLATMFREIDRLDWNTLTAFHLLDTPSTRSCLDGIRSTWYSTDYRLEKHVMLSFPERGDIAASFEKKARENLRNRTNKLEREKGSVEFRDLPAGMVDAAVDEYARQHMIRYGSRGGSWFRSPDNVRFLKDAIRQGVEGRYGYAHELLVDGEVAAQSFGFFEGGTALPYRFGMNDAFMAYSPGWQLQYRSFCHFRDRGIMRCSLGVGEESYKYRMGGAESPLLGVMARRGAVGLMDRMVRSSTAGLLGKRTGLFQ